jgi:hypothetical protein
MLLDQLNISRISGIWPYRVAGESLHIPVVIFGAELNRNTLNTGNLANSN